MNFEGKSPTQADATLYTPAQLAEKSRDEGALSGLASLGTCVERREGRQWGQRIEPEVWQFCLFNRTQPKPFKRNQAKPIDRRNCFFSCAI
jgi:hypothetical protein